MEWKDCVNNPPPSNVRVLTYREDHGFEVLERPRYGGPWWDYHSREWFEPDLWTELPDEPTTD